MQLLPRFTINLHIVWAHLANVLILKIEVARTFHCENSEQLPLKSKDCALSTYLHSSFL